MSPAQNSSLAPREARLYEKRPDNVVICHLCPHECRLEDGASGICDVRRNRGGTLTTIAYGGTTNRSADTVEKKPLFHFYPGTSVYSLSAFGCNMRCAYCINADISQVSRSLPEVDECSAARVIDEALARGCPSVGYTYVEPAIFYEYAADIADLARRAGLFNVFKTNGFVSRELLDAFGPLWDAANVDLKSFRESTYRHLGGRLQPVLDCLRELARLGVWLEVSTLVVPGDNDDMAEMKDIASFIRDELGPDTPWHILRFFPAYKMRDRPPTSPDLLLAIRDMGRAAGLHHVYIGGLLVAGGQDTQCSTCDALLIRRRGAALVESRLVDGRCPACGTLVVGRGMAARTTEMVSV
ncbi:MAG: AmmeMemoRadiSam system radical SAM enzyme [Capsulimonadaceae bacterium]